MLKKNKEVKNIQKIYNYDVTNKLSTFFYVSTVLSTFL